MTSENSTEPPNQKNFSILLEIQKNLEELFSLIEIKCEEQLTSVKKVPVERIKANSKKIYQLLHTILYKTKKIKSITMFTSYMEFGKILEITLSLLEYLISISSDISEFYRESHRLLKYLWGIRFIMARYYLEQTPEFRENQLLFFNFPDPLFEFILKLKEGPQPVEILAEIDLKLRVDKRLPLLLSRTPDHISLSPLGERLLKVHAISNFYYYYVYDFKEEVMDSAQNS